MLYQKMITGDKPYYVALRQLTYFKKHKHPELEIAYCLEGSYEIAINNRKYSVGAGDFAIIGSMVSHEICCDESNKNRTLIIEVGPVMMEKYFGILSKTSFPNPIIKLGQTSHAELYRTLSEIIKLLENFTPFSELAIKGNIYKLFACVLKDFVDEDNHTDFSRKKSSVSLVESAMEYIPTHYNENIKIEPVATMCGYSKSNFCKTFKQLFGETFHTVLNDYRIKIACMFLTETGDSVENIATQVGFADAKSFCRVFKSKKNISPKQYRIASRKTTVSIVETA